MRYTISDNLRGICEMTRRFEKGNVVGFVLIGVLLTALLVGGVWLARHPINSSSQVATDSNSTTTDKGTTNTADSDTDTTKATTDEELKAALAQQAKSAVDNNSSNNSTSSSSTAANLPATGPADVLFEMIGATALVGVTVAYVRSRSAA